MLKLLWLLPLLTWLGCAEARVVVRQNGPDVDVEFIHTDSHAGGVVVAGNFNEWSISSAVMTRGADGFWHYVLHGIKRTDVLQYKFVVGSAHQWIVDPDAPDTVSDNHGGTNGQVVIRQFLRSNTSDDIPLDLSDEGDPLPTAATPAATPAVKPADGGKNFIADPGFESGSLDGWTLRGNREVASNDHAASDAHAGEHSLRYIRNKPFRLLLLKKFSGLAPGTYSFRAWTSGGGGETSFKLFARDCGGPLISTPAINAGWQKWHAFVVKGIKVSGSECTVGIYIDAPAATWGNIDDVEFYEDATWTRLSVDPAN